MFRTALWTVATGLLAASSAAALDLRVLEDYPKMPAGFRKLWKDVAREFDELRQKDRSAQSRITELENQLRQARTRVARLEGQLTTVRSRLANAEKAAGAARATPDAAPAAPDAAPAAAALARIASRRSQVSGGYITVTGTVENVSDQTLTFVVVKATFLGRSGQVVNTGSGYATPRVIPPKGTGTFKIVVRDSSRIHRHQLTVEAR